ncbi:M12 family metallopeptidase [Bdellovibrio bacteriovorus]|uniref:Peptidase M12A domain-containing protein n=1 Tax=Bdellovibrio bacteriovorus str. Tiberius TaxID=1069642 RepID=K7YJD1_BDEBC|nr:M12 family metallopeptidase [Bdellovibrio bacteriovorus]AFX99765.1 hypothetical protein Bdt_0052 [Bdellovibrio bacteriovorus str. Tiberius]
MIKKAVPVLLVLAVVVVYLLWPKPSESPDIPQSASSIEHQESEDVETASDSEPGAVASVFEMKTVQAVSESVPYEEPSSPHDEVSAKNEVTYVVEDGVAVVNEDIVIGVPRSAKVRGSVALESVQLWEGGVVPFHIQNDVPNKSEIIQAIAAFVETPIKFVPYTNQEDVLVFEAGSGCKSYLGKVGGKQPLWISGGCGVTEITHEIMHALGFIHEQNRSDRDRFVEVMWDNIQEKYKHNFEIFPASLMVLSGASAFDYESVMLYQPTAFSENGGVTMKSKTESQLAPSAALSAGDIQRLTSVYGRN